MFLSLLALGAISSTASAQYNTGFESPIFTSGTVNGQDSWTSTTPTLARVLTDTEIVSELSTMSITPGQTVHSGSQALFISGTGGSTATIRAIGGLSSENNVTFDVWTRPLTSATVGNTFVTMEDAAGDRAAAFRFGPANSIDYATQITTGLWTPTGQTWNADTWYRMTLDVDYAAKTYNFSINGAQMNAQPIPFYTSASDNFAQIRFFRGSNQAGLIADDLTVAVTVPEPTTLSLIGLAGAALALGKRRVNRFGHSSDDMDSFSGVERNS